MTKKLAGWVATCAIAAVVRPAWAQDPPSAAGSVSLSTESGADASATGTAQEPAAFEAYEPGYPPDNNLLELGVFGGVLIPAEQHNLRNERFLQVPFKPGPELGARLGYYPLSFLGIEGEAMGALNKTKATDEVAEGRGGMYALRGQLVLQAPLPYVVPFAVGGVGQFGAISDVMGKDSDTAWHFGVGAKAALTHSLSLRLDGRDNLTAKTGGSGQAHTFEVTLGLSAVIERARREPPPPPADSDHDGVVDSNDKCPTDPGVAPLGCPADTDRDSVLDRDDYCPREAGPAPKGCPIID